MNRFRSEERGLAMVAVMGVLLVTSILALSVAGTAQKSNDDSVRDSNSKRALATAETGLNVGRFKVGKVFGTANTVENDAKCYPDTNPCSWSAPASNGNGAEYRYWVSPVLGTPAAAAAGITCVNPVTPPNPVTARERCVTAVGEMNGVQRQLQARVVENRGAPIFPFPGLFGLDSVSLNQSRAVGTIGSNGTVTIGPGSRVEDPGDIVLGSRDGTPGSVSGNQYEGEVITRDEFVADSFDQWYSDSRQDNANGTLPSGTVNAQRHANPPNNNGTITLTPGADYNFCSIMFNSGEKFVVAAGTTEPVRIFVDATPRPETLAGSTNYVGDGCPSVSKAIDAASGSGFVNETGDASMLQVFVYSGAVEFHSSAAFVGTLWAPNSDIVFNQGATLRGAMVGRTIRFNNDGQTPGFVGDDKANEVTGRWDGTYERNGWRECSARTGC